MPTREPQPRHGGVTDRRAAISVVIPTYDRAATVGRAVGSVLAQTFADLELIVVDDGSTDGTAEVLAGLDDPRLRVIRQENRGRSAARNRGVEHATAPWISFLDSDDEASPGWLEGFLERRRANPEASVICCGIRMKTDRPGAGLSQEGIRLPEGLGPMYEHCQGLFLAGSFAVKRELFVELGGYDESLAFSENTDLALRLTARCRRDGLTIATIAEPLVTIYNRRPVGGGRHSVERLRSAERMLERHGKHYRRHSRAGYANYHAIAGIHAARLGRFATARRHLLEALKVSPLRLKNYGRLALAILSPLGRRAWTRPRSGSP